MCNEGAISGPEMAASCSGRCPSVVIACRKKGPSGVDGLRLWEGMPCMGPRACQLGDAAWKLLRMPLLGPRPLPPLGGPPGAMVACRDSMSACEGPRLLMNSLIRTSSFLCSLPSLYGQQATAAAATGTATGGCASHASAKAWLMPC